MTNIFPLIYMHYQIHAAHWVNSFSIFNDIKVKVKTEIFENGAIFGGGGITNTDEYCKRSIIDQVHVIRGTKIIKVRK